MSDEWKACPFCGVHLGVSGPSHEVLRHPFDENCPLLGQFLWPEDKLIWNTRAPVSVQEAAKALPVDDLAAALWMADAHRTSTVISKNRTPEAFADESQATRKKWESMAELALRAIAEGGEA